jgi:hypothetical protein
MMHAIRGLGLAATLVLVSTVAVVPQSTAQSTSSTAAYVYIQIDGPQGAVYGFSASSTGKLSAIPGAPWKPTGQIVGSNKSQFITLGEDNIHSYAVASGGAIGSQLEQNPYTDYAGGECGTGSTADNTAVLDHTGKFVYIVLQTSNGISGCSSVQSFNINSAGAFDGVGDTVLSGDYETTLPSILGNESFAYANDNNSGPIGFIRESTGALESMQFHETNPTLTGGFYYPSFPHASPTGNYVVLQLFPNDANPFQLGSYTVDSQGNLSTTNTSSNMPTSGLIGASSTFSPSGNMYVLYADGGGNDEGQNVPGGIEIYNFNGAAPLTLYTKLLTGTSIDQVAWDNDNHLYAISKSSNMLYVYTVTPTSVTQDTAWSIGGPVKIVVVSESTSAAASPAVQYESTLFPVPNEASAHGTVTIDTEGDATPQIGGLAAGETYTLQFCPAYNPTTDAPAPACFNVAKVTTDSSGGGSTTVKFPKSGDWAGDFQINDSTGKIVMQSSLAAGLKDEVYFATLVPETKTNGGVVTSIKQQDPLSSGSVSYSNGTLEVVLKGASPNTSFNIVETETAYFDGSGSYELSPVLKTDATGDASSSSSLASDGGSGGDMLEVEGGSGAGFIGGFSIP